MDSHALDVVQVISCCGSVMVKFFTVAQSSRDCLPDGDSVGPGVFARPLEVQLEIIYRVLTLQKRTFTICVADAASGVVQGAFQESGSVQGDVQGVVQRCCARGAVLVVVTWGQGGSQSKFPLDCQDEKT